MIDEPFILSEEFQETLDLIEGSNTPVFLTGKAGTGKSTLLQLFRKTTCKKTVVLAPTGVAALNVNGQTIHSFFGFAPRLLSENDLIKRKDKKLLRALEVLVIDEISMVRADLLDHIDFVLRYARNSEEPFGGIQILLVGDLFQLPPVVSTPYEKEYFQTTYESPFFFSAKVFQQGFRLVMIELSKIYRQEEHRFVNMLDAIRSGDIDYELLSELNEQVQPSGHQEGDHIVLTARNQVANEINMRELLKLDDEPKTLVAKLSGHFNPALYPTEAALKLKIGARVMLLKNDPARRYVNGTIGTVTTIEAECISIRIIKSEKEEVVEVSQHEWEVLKYTTDPKTKLITTEVTGTFTQYPIRLAWAITIHKSQGKTFEKVLIDLQGGAFEHGQTYVALSRCRTLEGLVLKYPVKYRDILIDDRITDFYQYLNRY
ncbi:MAG: AAA family ATPase [Saprospiraceae bacterium]|nr:AAA family ATPase [Saprospiraceae bacterium]